jgi:hypothetical protein
MKFLDARSVHTLSAQKMAVISLFVRCILMENTEIDSYRLGISQKVNGADKPTSQLVAEVKNRLKKDPATVAPVILQHANPSALIRQDEEQQLTSPRAQAS